MFAYCSNSPVNYADHSGYFPLGAAIELLDELLSGDGDDQLYEEDSEIVKALNKSDKMHRFIDWAIDNYKGSHYLLVRKNSLLMRTDIT